MPTMLDDGQELRRLAAGSGQPPPDAAFERRHALFEDVGGGIHDAGVNVPELLQREQCGGVRGILEDVRGGLIDGHGARERCLVGCVAGVQRAGSEAHLPGGSGCVSHKETAYR